MGLVQSQPKQAAATIEVEGFVFSVEKSLQRFISVYGNLIIDFRNTFLGTGFTVNFSHGGTC